VEVVYNPALPWRNNRLREGLRCGFRRPLSPFFVAGDNHSEIPNIPQAPGEDRSSLDFPNDVFDGVFQLDAGFQLLGDQVQRVDHRRVIAAANILPITGSEEGVSWRQICIAIWRG